MNKKLIIIYILLVYLLVACANSKPASKDNSWNGYRDDCPSKPLFASVAASSCGFYHRRALPADWYLNAGQKGFVVLKNNDTVYGSIINAFVAFGKCPLSKVYVLPENKKDANDIIMINSSNINFYRVFNDSSYPQCYTDFINIKGIKTPDLAFYNCVWRLLAAKKDVKILDNFSYYNFYTVKNGILFTSAMINEMIIVKDDGTVIKVYPKFGYVHNVKRVIVYFINRRYKVNLKESNFKTVREMLNYILDKEIELEQYKK